MVSQIFISVAFAKNKLFDVGNWQSEKAFSEGYETRRHQWDMVWIWRHTTEMVSGFFLHY